MGAWDNYVATMSSIGRTKHDMWVNHSRDSLRRRMYDSPACHIVTIDGVEQAITVTHRDKLYQKRICAMPGESLRHGGLVEFAGNRWLITEVDADNEVYERGIMLQCNHVLRWISKDGRLIEKWCYVEDGTKYLIGEFSDRLMSIGDARIALTIGKDEDTVELSRGLRFLIDDMDSDNVTAYQITKSNRLFNNFNGEGVFKFILNEVTLTDDDHRQLRVANYSNWRPKRELDGDHKDAEYTVAQIVEAAKDKAQTPPDDDKEVWL